MDEPGRRRTSSASGSSGSSRSSSATPTPATRRSSARCRRCSSRARRAPTPACVRGRTRTNKTVSSRADAEPGELVQRAHRGGDLADAARRARARARRRLSRLVVAHLRRRRRPASRRSPWRSRARRRARSSASTRCRSYAGVETLTNQPSAAERAAAPHHLVGIWPLDHVELGGRSTRALAHAAIDDAARARRAADRVGGSGLYLRAALADLGLPPAVGRRAGAPGSALRPARARGRARGARAPRSARRRARSTRTTAARRAGARAGGAAARAWRPSATACGRARCARPALVFALDVAARRAARAHRSSARTPCSPAERSTRCGRCCATGRAVDDRPRDPRPGRLHRAPRGPYVARAVPGEIMLQTRRYSRRQRGLVGSRASTCSRAPTAPSATPSGSWRC